MRKMLCAALLLASLVGPFSPAQAQESAGQPVELAAMQVATFRSGPHSREGAYAFAIDLPQRGFRFIRYETDAAGYYFVIYTYAR